MFKLMFIRRKRQPNLLIDEKYGRPPLRCGELQPTSDWTTELLLKYKGISVFISNGAGISYIGVITPESESNNGWIT